MGAGCFRPANCSNLYNRKAPPVLAAMRKMWQMATGAGLPLARVWRDRHGYQLGHGCKLLVQCRPSRTYYFTGTHSNPACRILSSCLLGEKEWPVSQLQKGQIKSQLRRSGRGWNFKTCNCQLCQNAIIPPAAQVFALGTVVAGVLSGRGRSLRYWFAQVTKLSNIDGINKVLNV